MISAKILGRFGVMDAGAACWGIALNAFGAATKKATLEKFTDFSA
jgi:hypothetical protein